MKLISDLKIKKIVYQGYGLGFSDYTPIFVPQSTPGDILDVQVVHKKKNVKFAKIVKIKKASKYRNDAGCEVFGSCGGCDWLHIPYDKQLEYQEQIVREIFRDIEITTIEDIGFPEQDKYYRNKSFYPLSLQNNIPVYGMFEKRSHNVIQHKNCLIQPELFDEICKVVVSYLKASNMRIYNEVTGKGNARHIGIRYSVATGEIIVILVTKNRKIPFSKQLVRVLNESFSNIVGVVQNVNSRSTNVILGDSDKILFGRDHIYDEINGMRYKLHYRSFFQVNSQVTSQLYNFVKRCLDEEKTVIDAYSGVGAISINIANNVHRVIGIENNSNAVSDAKDNAKLNNVTNCTFICSNVENVLDKIVVEESVNTIIFDPPRKGLARKITKNLPAFIKKIIYISCNPTTQFRDVKLLMQEGYKVKKMKPFDMFPHTYHFENVVVLERNET